MFSDTEAVVAALQDYYVKDDVTLASTTDWGRRPPVDLRGRQHVPPGVTPAGP
jgi:hypothetical protein